MKLRIELLVFILFISCREKPIIIDCTEHTEINSKRIVPPPIDSIPTIGGGLPFKQTKLPKSKNSVKQIK
jgi:hypothetical protein